MSSNNSITRREALRRIGHGALGFVAAGCTLEALVSCKNNPEDLKVCTRKDKKNKGNISLLGFGCMRFPLTGDKIIDETLSIPMIDYAYNHGVNYFDTAYNYLGGQSEAFIGRALKKYPRKSFFLATKMPSWLVDSTDKAKELFKTQLERCQVEYFDFYLLHSLSTYEQFEKAYIQTGALDYLLTEKEAGRIHRLGFSFHGVEKDFDKILAYRNWDFVQIQLNYFDWEEQNAAYLYSQLEEKKIPCIVMEPIRGGMLASLNPDASAILKDVNPDKSLASWALRYLAELPNVLCILSGMSAMEHVTDNISTLADPKALNETEKAALEKALAIFRLTRPIRCTTCRYCMPCPKGVDIPAIFACYNRLVTERLVPDLSEKSSPEFEKRKAAFLEAFAQIPEEAGPQNCINCKQCTRHCPQRLPIPTELERILKLYQEVAAQ